MKMANPEVPGVDEVSIDEEVRDLKDEVLENQDDDNPDRLKDGKGDEGKEKKSDKTEGNKNKSAFKFGGEVGFSNRGIMSIGGSEISKTASYYGNFKLMHESGLGANVYRFDNFRDNSEGDNKTGRFTKMGLFYNDKFGLSKNWNVYLTEDVSYINFDNKFESNGKNVDLSEFMGLVQLKLDNGEDIAVSLSFLYNAFLNGVTPNNVISKLNAEYKLPIKNRNTKLYANLRGKMDTNKQKQLSYSLGVEQKLPNGFAAWLEGFRKNGEKGKIFFGLKKSF